MDNYDFKDFKELFVLLAKNDVEMTINGIKGFQRSYISVEFIKGNIKASRSISRESLNIEIVDLVEQLVEYFEDFMDQYYAVHPSI